MAMNNSLYRAYALFLMHELSKITKKGVGMDIDIYPCSDKSNTIIQVKMNRNNRCSYEIHDKQTLISSLYKVGLDKFVSPLEGVRFEGNNTFTDNDKILYVKENDSELFSEEAVIMDVFKLAKYKLGKV